MRKYRFFIPAVGLYWLKEAVLELNIGVLMLGVLYHSWFIALTGTVIIHYLFLAK